MGLNKEKLVIIAAGMVLAVNLFWPSKSFAETFPATPGAAGFQSGINAEQNDTNLPARANVPEAGAAVSRIEGELFYKMLLSVVLVIALGIAVIYVSKKVLPRFTNLPGKQIRVIETTHIAPRKSLHLVQVGTRRLLIASTNEQITMLADVTDSAGDFASQLEASSRRRQDLSQLENQRAEP